VNSAVEYLGRYAHKVAISNNRITAIDKINNAVTFNYKDNQACLLQMCCNRIS